MNEWQPMEKAPKDGTNILILQTSDGDYKKAMAVVFWYTIKRKTWKQVEDDPSRNYLDEWESSGWMDRTYGSLSPLVPSHWQPLPEIPK